MKVTQIMVQSPDMQSRFWAKVDKSDDCWLWTGARQKTGYGAFGFRSPHKQTVSAHRVAYELLVGPVPAGLELDHLCRMPPCVNPGHLEAVSHQVNVKRGAAGKPRGPQVAHCPVGHPYDDANTYIHGSTRNCRRCAADRMALRRPPTDVLPPSKRAHCPQGHAYDESNTYRLQGRRICRACRTTAQRARRAMHRCA